MRIGIAISIMSFFSSVHAWAGGLSSLPGHVPSKKVASSLEIGRKSGSDQIQLAVTLNSKDPEGLSAFIQRLNDPSDSLYHHFLTPQQFAAQFAISDDELNQISQYLTSQGLTITQSHTNHLVIDVVGPVSAIENAFQVEMHNYISSDGRVVYSVTSDPVVPDSIAVHFNGIVGLNNFSRKKNYSHRSSHVKLSSFATPNTSGVSDYLTPSKIKSVYNLSSTTMTGSGETLALFELDAYTASDISGYASYFDFTAPTVENVLVDGATGSPSSGADEVTLDIELAMALAPGLSKIIVYEGPPQTDTMTQTAADTEVIDIYSRIASDNLATVVSSSWGSAENETDSTVFSSENTILQQMAAQGQSFFAAAGDSGAYDDSPNGNNTTLEVDDPGSQPYATSVGGTAVSWSTAGAWSSETSWVATAATGTYGDSDYVEASGGGGGISTHWSIPTWQSGLSTTANKGSSAMRMVPDVSLEADPDDGYPIYYEAGWYLYGGTSCAAPLWAAFTALVNQERVAAGLTRVGQFNPVIYPIAKTAYSTDFHDIADGSTNLYYPAETGYDLTTGWGSFNGANLLAAMSATTTSVPAAPATLTLAPEALSITATWSASAGATSYTLMGSTSESGTYTVVASDITATSYTDSGLSTGTTYYYYVIAVDSAGSSPDSTIESATVGAVPGVPTGFTVQVEE